MSKIRVQWLWIVIAAEVVMIGALLVWGLVINQKEDAPAETKKPDTQQNTKPAYKTPKIELAQVVGGLTKPVTITAMPDVADKRLFVVEQDGLIRTVKADKTLDATPFLDIKSKVKSSGEMGLLGLAFHPNVADNRYFYVNYVDKNQATVIARYTISKTTGLGDPSSEKILLKISQPYPNHKGGNVAFGPDGYLYIGMGDGGSGGDPENRGQNKNELLGKMLRINVDSGDTYAIPADNPYANGGAKPEIWALGLRNPWRFSFDRKTGDLYIADVGQGDYEEINLQKAGSKGAENYGWRCYEGVHEYKTDGCQSAESYVKPIVEYNHTEGRCSVTGGYAYQGSKYPALTGKYFYADFCGGQLYYAEQASGTWTVVSAGSTGHQVSTFGEDSSGEVYLANYGTGVIYQITDTAN